MGRFDIFPIFIATFASRRVTLIATHSKSQKQTRLPIRYLYFILPFKLLINKEVIKVFQNYKNILRYLISVLYLCWPVWIFLNFFTAWKSIVAPSVNTFTTRSRVTRRTASTPVRLSKTCPTIGYARSVTRANGHSNRSKQTKTGWL